MKYKLAETQTCKRRADSSEEVLENRAPLNVMRMFEVGHENGLMNEELMDFRTGRKYLEIINGSSVSSRFFV